MNRYLYLVHALYSSRYIEDYYFDDYDKMLDFIDHFDDDVEYITYYLEEDIVKLKKVN